MMIKSRGLLILLLLCLFVPDLSGQKVKYKDLYVLLNANDFEQAEPFLRRFMAQEPEHANANLYMGRMFQSKYKDLDVLKDTDEFIMLCDSSVLYFRKSYSLIDEKEIKKNDEYYQDYSRRDLRTGKFGVKEADVKFDLENKIDEGEKLSKNVKIITQAFNSAVTNYALAESTYNALLEQFGDYTHLLLKAEQADLDSLDALAGYYEDFDGNFQNYKKGLLQVSVSNYDQELNVHEISEMNETSSPDFYADEVEVYDFKTWSEVTKGIIVDEIGPLKDNMATYDNELDELYKLVKHDSATVENELADLTEKMFFEQLRNYDQDPLPSLIFNFKVEEITYYSFLNHRMEEGLTDTTNIDLRIATFEDLKEKFDYVNDAYFKLAKVNIEEKSDLYSGYIEDRYGDPAGLASYVGGKEPEINEHKTFITLELDSLHEKAKWGIHDNDSIPLFVMDTLSYPLMDTLKAYHTLKIDSLDSGFLALGLESREGEIRNFAAKIGFSRMADTLYTLPLKSNTIADSIKSVHAWSDSYHKEGETEKLMYVFQMAKERGFIYELANLQMDKGLRWSSSFESPYSVLHMTVDTNTSLIVLKMGIPEEDGEGEERENLIFNFDGKLLVTGGN